MTEMAFPMPDGSRLGGPYTAEDLHRIFHYLVGGESGIVPSVAEEVEATISGSGVRVGTGGAIIHGIGLYVSPAEVVQPENIPTVGNTGMLAVLTFDWDGQETGPQDVRLEIKSNTDGNSSIPSATDNYGTKIEFPLASFVMDTSGGITSFTDKRAMLTYPDVDTADNGALKAWATLYKWSGGSIKTPSLNTSGFTYSSPTGTVTFGNDEVKYVLTEGANAYMFDAWSSDTVATLTLARDDTGNDSLMLGFGAIVPEVEG